MTDWLNLSESVIRLLGSVVLLVGVIWFFRRVGEGREESRRRRMAAFRRILTERHGTPAKVAKTGVGSDGKKGRAIG